MDDLPLGALDAYHIPRGILSDAKVEQEPRNIVAPNKDWTTADTLRQGALSGLFLADRNQSMGIARSPSQWQELNPMMGSHPSAGKFNNAAALSILGSYLLANYLPPDWRAAGQYAGIGLEGFNVLRNARVAR